MDYLQRMHTIFDHIFDFTICAHIKKKIRRVPTIIIDTFGPITFNWFPRTVSSNSGLIRISKTYFLIPASLAIVGLRLEAVVSNKKCKLWKCLRIVIYFTLNKFIIIIISLFVRVICK